MKVESITMDNFKLFDRLTVSFKNKTLREVSDRFLVLGDNGKGKTTLLQAVALPLALATRQTRTVADFDWIGFVPGRFLRWGLPRVEIEVSFADEELSLTGKLAEMWYETLSEDFKAEHPFIRPGENRLVKLTLLGDTCQATTRAEYLQFQGRYYAQRLLKTNPSIRQCFHKLPGVFWFDQFRNLGSTLFPAETQENGVTSESARRVSFEIGVERLRRYLNGWKLAQQSRSEPYRVDYLMNLENLYKRVFPGRSFAGVEPMPDIESPTPKDFYFLLNDGHRTYDIVEMSAGEQAVFPILYEFVRQQIAYSVVLIDEIDLNLHPPVAQLLVSQLPRISATSQFIFTSHSEAVSSIVSSEETYRLAGGSLCL